MTRNKRVLALIAWGYVTLGVVLAGSALFVDADTRGVLSLVAMVVLFPSAVVLRRVHRAPTLLIASLGVIALLYGLSNILGELVAGTAGEIIVNLLDIAATMIILVLVAYSVRQRRGRFTSGDVLDGVIIGVGAWLIAWIVLVQPYLDSPSSSPALLILNAFYLPMTVPLLVLAAIFVFTAQSRRVATWCIITSLLVNVLGDFIYALEETRGMGLWAITVADSLYIIAFTFTGAAFIHPTAPELTRGSSHRPRLQLPGRVITTAVALVFPVMVLSLVPANSTPDRLMRAAFALALLVLVGGRLYQSTKSTLETQSRLLEVARTDDLTTLPNKAALLEQAEDEIDVVWRTETRPSLYLFDLDRFKNINDSLGHAAGDEVLHVIADRLDLAATSIGATVARPSGDEFLILDPSPTTSGQALANAEVLHSVFKQPLSISDGVVFVTASVGVASMPSGRPLTGEELFRWADIAMYRAKDAGRNCIAVYHESMQERISQRMEVETALHGALDRREFRLFHQPIVDTVTGRVTGFEALIRWQKSDGSIVSPAEFIPIAEDTGMIVSIGAWALLEALTQLRTWVDDGVVPTNTTVSVNVSPRQLANPNFTDTVEEALSRSGLPAHLLWLEVTESVMVDNPELARATLQRIRAMGVRIALDDFGTGYSSLSLLQRFPLQRIKIDREFVAGIAESANDRSLVRTIIGMGASMGLDIVAEGVETVQQLKMLRELECSKAQGFLISHPVPAEAMRSTIAALESLAQWPEFSQLLGDSSLGSRSPISGN